MAQATAVALAVAESQAMDKKTTFARLDIELTRRCNMACRHCYNGAAQVVDIPREYMDNLLGQTAEIGQLYIKGGETLLNLPALEYLVDQIIRRKIPVHYFAMVTNGTVQSTAACKAVNRMAEHIVRSRHRNTFQAPDRAGNKNCASVTVSNDHWHTEWLRSAREFESAKLILLNAWNDIAQRRRVTEFCPLEADELETIMDSVKQGRPQQYGEELIVLHNDAVDRGVTVKPMRHIDAAQKDTIVNAVLNSAV